jgi:hypothetical protein
VAVADGQLHAFGVAALATLLAAADAAAASFTTWKAVLAGGFGYSALAFAIHHALLGEKRRLATLRAELARLTSGIDQLDTASASLPLSAARATLRQASEDGRRARQLDRAAELDEALARLVRLARSARTRTRCCTSTSTASATPRSCARPTARRSCASRRWCR